MSNARRAQHRRHERRPADPLRSYRLFLNEVDHLATRHGIEAFVFMGRSAHGIHTTVNNDPTEAELLFYIRALIDLGVTLFGPEFAEGDDEQA